MALSLSPSLSLSLSLSLLEVTPACREGQTYSFVWLTGDTLPRLHTYNNNWTLRSTPRPPPPSGCGLQSLLTLASSSFFPRQDQEQRKSRKLYRDCNERNYFVVSDGGFCLLTTKGTVVHFLSITALIMK